jgi:hypothetical protein
MFKALLYSVFFGVANISFSQTDINNKKKFKDSLNDPINVQAYNTSGSDIESEIDDQEVSSLLQSSRDVFTQFVSFQFGMSGYRLRGYASKNQIVMINGAKLNSPETGMAAWSSWSGLNDITRNVESGLGNAANRLGFTALGTYANIETKASAFRKGTRLSYTHSNRNFRNGIMITHATGLLKNGWSMSWSASVRRGNEVYRPGTFFEGYSFFVSFEKQINARDAIHLSTFYTPTEIGRSTAETLEAFQLAKNNYYNSLWGYQNGKARNANVSRQQKPLIMLSHSHQFNTASQLCSNIFLSLGKSILSGLNWNNAADPRPDYYAYLPSYFYDKGDSLTGNLINNQWSNDLNRRQINWDQMIAVNQNNLFTLPGQLGQGINTSETRARYIVENRIENLVHCGVNSVFNQRYNNLFLSIGINASLHNNRKYKKVNDLLGASFWLDYDMFAPNSGVDPNIIQNNIEQPDKKLYKNNRFGYDYTIHLSRSEIWSTLEYNLKRSDFYLSASVSNQSTWREGFLANGKFPNTSKGNSDKATFLNAGLKSGITFKISGKHFITINNIVMTRAPDVAVIFTSPTTRNELTSNLQNEKIISGDINYHIKLTSLKMRFTAYHTLINNQMWSRTYYSDVYNTNVNLIMKNINQIYQGLELGLEKTWLTSHVIQIAAGFGQFIYNDRPKLEAWQDNNSSSLFSNRIAYLKNYRIGITPQLVAGLGYRYNRTRNWFMGINLNFFDQIFVEPNPDRRTAEALSTFFINESAQYKKIIEQERLPAYFIVNISAGKMVSLGKKNTINFNLGINNISNNKNNIGNGREQMRWDYTNINKFANKYNYLIGTTYMAIANFSF